MKWFSCTFSFFASPLSGFLNKQKGATDVIPCFGQKLFKKLVGDYTCWTFKLVPVEEWNFCSNQVYNSQMGISACKVLVLRHPNVDMSEAKALLSTKWQNQVLNGLMVLSKSFIFLQMNVYGGNLVQPQWPSFTQTEKEDISFDKVTTHF